MIARRHLRRVTRRWCGASGGGRVLADSSPGWRRGTLARTDHSPSTCPVHHGDLVACEKGNWLSGANYHQSVRARKERERRSATSGTNPREKIQSAADSSILLREQFRSTKEGIHTEGESRITQTTCPGPAAASHHPAPTSPAPTTAAPQTATPWLHHRHHHDQQYRHRPRLVLLHRLDAPARSRRRRRHRSRRRAR